MNIPIAIGAGGGAKLSGWEYGEFGEKATLAIRYLAEQTETGKSQAWDGKVSALEFALVITRADADGKLQDMLGIDAVEATRLLWDTYNPHIAWIPFIAVVFVAAFARFVFNRVSLKWSDMNV